MHYLYIICEIDINYKKMWLIMTGYCDIIMSPYKIRAREKQVLAVNNIMSFDID